MSDSRMTRNRGRHNLRFLLLLGCAGLSAAPYRVMAAGAQPAGGHYVAGTGNIAASGATTTITQSSSRGIIDWRSFSVGKGNKVQFDNGSGATLNRVTGGRLSTIAGDIAATGSVYLINRNGVVVDAGGKIVTGGNFVASTRDMGNSQFMAGTAQTFTGSSTGAVVNDGMIVSQDGSVALIGHAVTNVGTIDAAKGTASLSAGNRVVLSDASGPDGIYVAAGASGDVTNSGRIKAAAAALASAGGNVYALAGNRAGLIQATGTKTVDGQVWLTADAGTADVGGKVVATDADGSGGTITAKGETLKLVRGAILDAAGRNGHGKIETSGNHVSIGKAKVTAGQHGDWLIDPVDLTIDSGAVSSIDSALAATTNVFERTTAVGSSGSGTPTSGQGNINVEAAITWSTTAQLSLSAFHSINIDAPITATGNGQVVLVTNNNLGGGISSGGTLNFTMGHGSIQIAGATGGLTIDGTVYTLVQNTTELQAVTGAGDYALAGNLDAGAVPAFVPIGAVTAFTGTFNGLGNNVSNLAVTSVLGETGLFGQVGAGGVVANVGLIGASISGNGNTGALVGLNSGTVSNVTATGSVTGVNSAAIGGLVGRNFGTITGSSTDVLVIGAVSSLDGGLVGQNEVTGTITNSHATGTTQGDNDSANGGLAGINYGAIANSYATGTVTTALGSGSAQSNGGLVGDNYQTGTISDSYATGAVIAHTLSAYAAGLSGYNDGAISNSYATGSVTAGAGTIYAGGLVGLGAVNGTITASYATGVTTGAAVNIGGLVGSENGAAAVNSYWDIGTTGQSTSASGTGKTTLELQSALLTGFTGADWSIVQGKSYPYLNFQFAGTPQVVAGTVYTDGGTTNAGAGITVNAVADGNTLTSALTGGTVTTASDGYYYYLLAPGTVAANGNVIVSAEHYGTGNAQSGAALADQSNGYPIHLDILANTFHIETPQTDLTSVTADVTVAEGGSVALTGLVNGLANLRIDASGSFNIDSAVSYSSGTVTLDVGGTLDQSGGIITAGTLTGSSVGGATLNGSNQVKFFGPFADAGSSSTGLQFTDARAFQTVGTLSAVNGGVHLNAGGNLTLGGDITATGQQITLIANGAISQTTGVITGAGLSGSAVSGVRLTDANQLFAFGNFANTGSGALRLTDAGALNISGPISSAGNLTLTADGLVLGGNLTATGKTVTLTSSGTISQSGGITAGTLTGSSVGGAILNGANSIGIFNFSNGGPVGSDLDFTDAAAVTVSGATSTNNVVLTTTTGAGMRLTGTVHGGANVSLVSAGKIVESGGGLIETGAVFSGSAVGGARLTGNNAVDAFENFTNMVSGDISFRNIAVNAEVAGIKTQGNLTLTAPGVQIAGNLTAGSGKTVTLTVAGAITQLGGTIITANLLTGSSIGGAVLTGDNQVNILGSFSDTGIGNTTGLNFSDMRALRIGTGVTVSSTGPVRLSTFGGTSSSLSLDGDVTASGNIVALNSAGAITQTAAGIVTAGTLTGSSVGGATLSGANLVTSLALFTNSGSGLLSVTDAQSLATTGTVISAGSLTLTTTAGNLTLGGDVTASSGTVTLASAGTIGQSGGIIDPGALLINSVGSVSLPGANTVDTLAARITGAGSSLRFNDTANNLTIGTVAGISGVTTGNGDITLRTTTSGTVTLARAVDAGTAAVTVGASGDLTIGAGGSASAGGGVTFATSGNFTNDAGAGAISVGPGSRWLVYSSDPNADADGGLTPTFIQYAATYNIGTLSGTAPAASGNGFLYRLAPQITLTAVTKTYDGTTNLPAGTSGYSFSGTVSGDAVTLDAGGVTGSFADRNAGSGIDVSANGLTVTATRGGIQVFGYAVNSAASDPIGKVTPATLTYIAGSASRAYGSGNSGLTGSVTGFVGSDTLGNATTGTLDFTSVATGVSNVGAYAIDGGGLTADHGNYVFVQAAGNATALTVSRAVLAITGGDLTKTYGQTASLSGTDFTTVGLQNGETVGSVTLTSAGAAATANAGAYDTNAANATGGTFDAANYTISYHPGTLTVNPASLVITATDAAKTYGQLYGFPGTGFTASGLRNGESIGSVILASAGAAATADVSGSPYIITVSGAAGGTFDAANYAITYHTGALTVDPATLTAGLTGDIGRNFNGTTTATLSPGNYTLTGLVNGDAVTLNDPASGSYATANPGAGIAVTVTGLALLGAKADDYRLASTTITANIGTIVAVAPPTPAAPPTQVGTTLVPILPPGGAGDSFTIGAGNGLGQLPSIVKQDAEIVGANGVVLSSGLHPALAVAPMVAPALASGCANEDMVAVIPESNGHVGAVVVESGGNKTLLNSAYASCSGSKPGKIDPQLVKDVFGDALAARPTPPISFQLFCATGSVALVPSSLDALDKVLQEIARRGGIPDIVVTGFTDTKGTVAHNDALSVARAKSVSKMLVARGVSAGAISTFGRGERGLLVPTKDQVAEEKNRRIEVTVR